jgi:hypothetical protein
MNAIAIARKVQTDKQALLFRQNFDGSYNIKELFSGNKRGWTILDGFTASAIMAVHDALNDTNKARFSALPLIRMATVAFRLVK